MHVILFIYSCYHCCYHLEGNPLAGYDADAVAVCLSESAQQLKVQFDKKSRSDHRSPDLRYHNLAVLAVLLQQILDISELQPAIVTCQTH